MFVSKPRRKVILLYARLHEILTHKEEINGWTIDLEIIGRQGKTLVLQKNGQDNYIANFSERQLEGWQTSSNFDEESQKKLDVFVTTLFGRKFAKSSKPISANDCADENGLFHFGEQIGLSKAKIRYIIDRKLSRDLPTYNSQSIDKKSSRKFIAEFGGLYYFYRHDVNSETHDYHGGAIVKGTLSIRYPLEFPNYRGESKRNYRVRCKLNLPDYNDRKKTYKYDGYVWRSTKSKSDYLVWLLQERSRDQESVTGADVIFMYTEVPPQIPSNNESSSFMAVSGIALTQNQDGGVPTVSNICLIRNESATQEELEKPILTTPKHLKKKLPKNTAKMYESYWKTKGPDEREFMRNELGLFALAVKSDGLIDQDIVAIDMLLQSEFDMNLKGFHL